MARLLELVRSEFERIGLPAPVPAPWMSDPQRWRDARDGSGPHDRHDPDARDPDRRRRRLRLSVFGVDNLYVAGGSVYPTSGHANPTLTIVALAIRLADHLLRQPAPSDARSKPGLAAL